MGKWTTRAICITVLVLVALFAIQASNSYFSNIAAADTEGSEQEGADVNNWYDYQAGWVNSWGTNKNKNENGMYDEIYNNPNGGSSDTGHPLDNMQFPVFTNGLEAYKRAEEVLRLASGVQMSTTGVASASAAGVNVDQKLRAFTARTNDGKIYSNSASLSSMKATASEMYYDTRLLKVRNTTDVKSNLTGNFKDSDWRNSSASIYERTYGYMPDKIGHVINENTVKNITNFKYENGLYSFEMELEVSAAEKIKYNIMSQASSNTPPTFHSMTMKVVIDSNARFKEITFIEDYSLSTPVIGGIEVTARCKATYTQVFQVIHGTVTVEKPSGF